jgi:BMFP domain-containing protein YqiC
LQAKRKEKEAKYKQRIQELEAALEASSKKQDGSSQEAN